MCWKCPAQHRHSSSTTKPGLRKHWQLTRGKMPVKNIVISHMLTSQEEQQPQRPLRMACLHIRSASSAKQTTPNCNISYIVHCISHPSTPLINCSTSEHRQLLKDQPCKHLAAQNKNTPHCCTTTAGNSFIDKF